MCILLSLNNRVLHHCFIALEINTKKHFTSESARCFKTDVCLEGYTRTISSPVKRSLPASPNALEMIQVVSENENAISMTISSFIRLIGHEFLNSTGLSGYIIRMRR